MTWSDGILGFFFCAPQVSLQLFKLYMIFLLQAHIFCRSHGFTSAFEIRKGSDFGVMSMKFATNGFSCFGYETELLDCQYNVFTYCTEYDAAGVVCSSKYNTLKPGCCIDVLSF